VFSPALLFNSLYKTACVEAVREYTAQIDVQEKFINDLEHDFCQQFDDLISKEGKSVTLARLYQLRPLLVSLQKNHSSCFCCAMSVPEKVLDCGHAYCDNCIKTFGTRAPTNLHEYLLSRCPMCGAAHSRTFRFKPPTARVRVRSLNSGGIRGIVLLTVLRYLDTKLAFLGCPIQDYFNFVAGTSSSMFEQLTNLFLTNPLQGGLSALECF